VAVVELEPGQEIKLGPLGAIEGKRQVPEISGGCILENPVHRGPPHSPKLRA
jgi:hypothetical protein